MIKDIKVCLIPFLLFSLNILTTVKLIAIAVVCLIIGERKDRNFIVDRNSIFIFIFISLYLIFTIYNAESVNILDISFLYFILFSYCVGLNLKLKAHEYSLVIKSALVSISIVPILSIFLDVTMNGFGGDSDLRSMSYFYNPSVEISATVMAGFLFLPAIFFSLIYNKLSLLNTLFSALVLFCIMRLGSRTLILIILTMVFIGFIFSDNSLKKLIFKIFSAFFFIFLISYLINFSYYFEDRVGDSEYGIATAGGRLTKWKESFDYIFIYPFGWDLSLVGYAHNVYLDIARAGGVIPLVAFILFCLNKCITLINDIKSIKNNEIKIISICILVVYFLVSMVEPLFDGFIYYFSTYMFIVGVIRNYTSKCFVRN